MDLFTVKWTILYEELLIPTLTNEQRQSAEGKISLEGCTKVLNSFPLNKVPVNDATNWILQNVLGFHWKTFSGML